MYTDRNHTTKDVFNLSSPPFKSNIYFLNPANTGWQNYLAGRNKQLYAVYDFDGYQIDQVGNRNKNLYDYDGNKVNLAATFEPFIQAMKKASPDKSLVMNAVNQYGQQGIATAPVDFLYTEVWAPDDGYADLASVIQDNNRYSGNQKQTVLAAYMDYDLAEHSGFFNTPGVLLTDAVIFAFGGAHLELGEHMLGKEYFPNDNLQMHHDLQVAMIHYYDFLTAYENLLRGGGTFNKPQLQSTDGKMQLNNWPPARRQVAVVGKEIGARQIIHLINFSQANSLNWRDASGTQPVPDAIINGGLSLITSKEVKAVWFASPDVDFGAPRQIAFAQSGDVLSFSLPSLKYWDMVVVEYK
jgi:dextranase